MKIITASADTTGDWYGVRTPKTQAAVNGLSDEQVAFVVQIINRYDRTHFTFSDREQMFQDITNSGIPINHEVMQLLGQYGFNVLTLTPAEQGLEVSTYDGSDNSTDRDNVYGLYLQYRSGNITEEEFRSELALPTPTYTDDAGYGTGRLIHVVA